MKIIPTLRDLNNWINCAPEFDLVFFGEKFRSEKNDLITQLTDSLMTREEVKSLGAMWPWTLNNRSWYGYALNQADYCISLPMGKLESLPDLAFKKLAYEQRRLKVPTMINGEWITSKNWFESSKDRKIQILELWFIQNEIDYYESLEFDELSNNVKNELLRVGYAEIVNRFASHSGPNCFSTVAAAITLNLNQMTSLIWMHWPELESRLKSLRYEPVKSDTPLTGDVFVFMRDEMPIHAAYYLGEGLYFEKPGQDFYEPYRIAHFRNWESSWKDTKLFIWRRI